MTTVFYRSAVVIMWKIVLASVTFSKKAVCADNNPQYVPKFVEQGNKANSLGAMNFN